jgi:hypothetical protein
MNDKTLYKPFKSKAKNKLYSVYVKDEKTGKTKLIHFGDNRYTQNQTPEQRRGYISRASQIRDGKGRLTRNNKNSANYWSMRYLWNYKG